MQLCTKERAGRDVWFCWLHSLVLDLQADTQRCLGRPCEAAGDVPAACTASCSMVTDRADAQLAAAGDSRTLLHLLKKALETCAKQAWFDLLPSAVIFLATRKLPMQRRHRATCKINDDASPPRAHSTSSTPCLCSVLGATYSTYSPVLTESELTSRSVSASSIRGRASETLRLRLSLPRRPGPMMFFTLHRVRYSIA